MKTIEYLEKKSGIPFDKLIMDLHFDKNMSLRSIAIKYGITHTALSRAIKFKSIKVRKKNEASSLRMKLNNPSYDPIAQAKRAKTIRDALKKRDLQHEIDFRNILLKNNVEFIEQHPIESFNIDFFIPKFNLCIEIDSNWKWSFDKRLRSIKRDSKLKSLGLWTLRITKQWVKHESFIVDILKTYNIIC